MFALFVAFRFMHWLCWSDSLFVALSFVVVYMYNVCCLFFAFDDRWLHIKSHWLNDNEVLLWLAHTIESFIFVFRFIYDVLVTLLE